MIRAFIIRNLEKQIKTALNISDGFKIVFQLNGFRILISVFDQNKNRVKCTPMLFAEVSRTLDITSPIEPELAQFFKDHLAGIGKTIDDVTRNEAVNLIYIAVTRAYRLYGTFPPSLNGLD